MLEFFVVTVPFPGNQGYCFHSGILFNERVLNSEEQTDGVMTGPLRAVVNYHTTVVIRRIIYIYHPRFQQVRGNEKVSRISKKVTRVFPCKQSLFIATFDFFLWNF